ncbi:unnamed protein product [Protopolystoma xenopodis]|uniref:Uncharacterized protein n=1 Tax=Protopolystoma xenopodis TaxID=117903 RepID=A0A448X4P1_9PLAT|nr:unnamed protein product [Protopolystoma xenopodis]
MSLYLIYLVCLRDEADPSNDWVSSEAGKQFSQAIDLRLTVGEALACLVYRAPDQMKKIASLGGVRYAIYADLLFLGIAWAEESKSGAGERIIVMKVSGMVVYNQIWVA